MSLVTQTHEDTNTSIVRVDLYWGLVVSVVNQTHEDTDTSAVRVDFYWGWLSRWLLRHVGIPIYPLFELIFIGTGCIARFHRHVRILIGWRIGLVGWLIVEVLCS